MLFDYFVADSDELAASTLDGGPGAGAASGAEPRFPFVDGKGIDPFVMMGKLEALLTGRTYAEVDAACGNAQPLAMIDSGERVVERLWDSLVASLASASSDRLAEVAVPWSQTEEFWGHGQADALAGFLEELAQLAQLARSSGQHMYCWTCV